MSDDSTQFLMMPSEVPLPRVRPRPHWTALMLAASVLAAMATVLLSYPLMLLLESGTRFWSQRWSGPLGDVFIVAQWIVTIAVSRRLLFRARTVPERIQSVLAWALIAVSSAWLFLKAQIYLGGS